MTFLLPPGSKGFKDHGIELHWFLVFYLNRCTVFLASPKLVYLKLRYRSSHATGAVLENVFLNISQNLQENTSDRVSFSIIFCNFLKKILWHRCFLVNFVKISRAPFSQNTSGQLLLQANNSLH